MQPRERRRFSRIPFDGSVQLISGDRTYETEINDISLKGALIKRPPDMEPSPDENMRVVIHGLNDSFIISMDAKLEHIEKDFLGLKCIEIDIDSATNLRRLVELNLGDTALLNRELAELADSNYFRNSE